MATSWHKPSKTALWERGVVVCGSGIGISIAMNRYPEVRCALIHDSLGAKLCREHNNANVIAFGERTTGEATAIEALNVFLNTEFEGGRHERRVEKLSNPPLWSISLKSTFINPSFGKAHINVF